MGCFDVAAPLGGVAGDACRERVATNGEEEREETNAALNPFVARFPIRYLLAPLAEVTVTAAVRFALPGVLVHQRLPFNVFVVLVEERIGVLPPFLADNAVHGMGETSAVVEFWHGFLGDLRPLLENQGGLSRPNLMP